MTVQPITAVGEERRNNCPLKEATAAQLVQMPSPESCQELTFGGK